MLLHLSRGGQGGGGGSVRAGVGGGGRRRPWQGRPVRGGGGGGRGRAGGPPSAGGSAAGCLRRVVAVDLLREGADREHGGRRQDDEGAGSGSPRAAGPDWAGFVIFTAALASLVYGLIESNQRSFTDGLVLGCLAAAAVLLAVFVIVERRSAHPMFDLKLLRLPTFSGGSVAAFGLSASIFSMLLYLVLYLQDILGYSPLGTGVRLMYLSGAILVSATVAGRLSSRVPVGLLIGPGLIIIGVSLLLMRGLNAGSTWTHLIPGMIAAGVGVGLVNPPLASTAVGVVPPQQAGMASGINSTFRQVGIATGIALLGTLFSNDVKDEVLTRTAAVPGLSARGPEIAGAVQSGQIGDVIARLPAPARQVVGTITRAAFTTGLNRILLVAAIIAFVAGVVSLAAIRSRDFARAAPGGRDS